MLALYRCGRQAEALAVYRETRATARRGTGSAAGSRAGCARASRAGARPKPRTGRSRSTRVTSSAVSEARDPKRRDTIAARVAVPAHEAAQRERPAGRAVGERGGLFCCSRPAELSCSRRSLRAVGLTGAQPLSLRSRRTRWRRSTRAATASWPRFRWGRGLERSRSAPARCGSPTSTIRPSRGSTRRPLRMLRLLPVGGSRRASPRAPTRSGSRSRTQVRAGVSPARSTPNSTTIGPAVRIGNVVPGGPGAVAAHGNTVWVAPSSGLLTRLDRRRRGSCTRSIHNAVRPRLRSATTPFG